jgi:hypothetical protein
MKCTTYFNVQSNLCSKTSLGTQKSVFCSKVHRCTVVGNPGGGGVLRVFAKLFLGGTWGFGQILFRGVFGVVK